MAPSIVQNVTQTVSDLTLNPVKGKGLVKEPLKSTGSLDSLPHEDLTPAVGTEFSSATQLSALLNSPNVDQLIRDLAILGNPPAPLVVNPWGSISTSGGYLPSTGPRY
jgi:hypothetical protein